MKVARLAGLLRNRAEFLGIVQAADEGAAEKAAIKAFALDARGRERLGTITTLSDR